MNEIKNDLILECDYENNDFQVNEDCLYEMNLSGNFESIEFNMANFKNELYKILPNNTITLGFMCTVCGTWMDNIPTSLCSMCNDNAEEDLERIKKGQENYLGMKLLDWVEHYEYKKKHELDVAFSTTSKIDIESILKNFKAGNYVKSINIYHVKASNDNTECQYPIDRNYT